MRITAFGDLHLDSAFVAYGIHDASARREMLRTVFLNIISTVKENNSDLLLICGDLFDLPTPTPESASLVISELSSLDIPVFITPGNHDYYIEGGVYDNMPQNVFVFKNEELESVSVDSLGVCVDGYAFLSDAYNKNPLSGYKSAENTKTRILCAHTDMSTGSKYAPFDKEDLAKTEFVFAALGHVHGNTAPFNAGSCTAAYSGAVQGKGFDEPQNGFLNVIDIDENNICSVEQISVALWNNLIYQISVDDAASDQDILRRITAECNNTDMTENDTVRIELVGEYDFHFSPNINYITLELKKLFNRSDIFLKNYSSPKLDGEFLSTDPSVAGVLYRTLFEDTEFMAAYSEDARKRAFNLSMKALTGNDIDPESI